MAKSNPATENPESDYEADELRPEDVFEESAEEYDEPKPTREPRRQVAEDPEDEPVSRGALRDRLGSSLRSRPVRPGDEEIVSSKSVWIKSGIIFALVVIVVVFWFVNVRTAAEKDYKAAQEYMDQGQYAQAIVAWEEFLNNHSRDPRARDARIQLGTAHIEKNTVGGSPDWEKGLEELDKFIKINRDDPDFGDLREQIRGYAERIALGSAKDAGVSNNRDLLKVADQAANLVGTYSPENTPDPEFVERHRNLVRESEKQIVRKETVETVLKEIESLIEEKKPMQALERRVRLIQQYADLQNNAKVSELLQNTLQTEQSLIQREELNREASREDTAAEVAAPLSLTFHPRPLDQGAVRGNSLVYAVSQGCCYGIDPISGDPVWRRVIGFDTPFFPIEVSASVPGLLVFDTNAGELVLLDSRSGKLIWRQRLSEQTVETVNGPPLVQGGQIYLPTRDRHLYKIDLESGRISTKLTFSQQVNAPPVLTPGGQKLILAGGKEVLYTLSLTPLECKEVSYLGHADGTIEAPLLVMGNLLLICENDRSNGSRLRVLSLREGGRWLEELDTARVDGQVRDQPVLRGNQLLLPSSQERVAAFQVTDDPDGKPLTELTRFSEKSTHTGPTYLIAGPGGTFWMASRALRRFRLQTDVISPESNEIAVGVSTQPPRVSGRNLYLGRRLPYSNSVIFEQADAERMVSTWRTVLGSQPLGWSWTGGQFAICVNETGELFRVSEAEIEKGGFLHTAILQLNPLPEEMTEPLHATDLGEGRLGVYSGDPSPTVWFINPLGQITRSFRLEKPLQAEPVVLGRGVVLPLPGKLKLIGITASGAGARDFLTPVGQEEDVAWKQLAAADANHVLAIDSLGNLRRIQHQTVPISSLREVTSRVLENPVDYRVQVLDRRMIAADAGGNLQMIDTSSLETVSSIRLDAPVSNDLWLIGNRLYVEVGKDRLECFEIGADFKPLWSAPLNGNGLVGEPLALENLLVAASANGDALAIDAETGEIQNKIRLGQPPGMGPKQFGKLLIVPSIDGSLYRINSLLRTEP